jgi:hypothetical protein
MRSGSRIVTLVFWSLPSPGGAPPVGWSSLDLKWRSAGPWLGSDLERRRLRS